MDTDVVACDQVPAVEAAHIQDKQQELGQQIIPKLEAVLKELTDQEKYDVILERRAILYSDAKHDITQRVTELLNAKKGS